MNIQNPTPIIQAGHLLIFEKRTKCVSILTETRKIIHWPNGDDKKYVDFIGCKETFGAFAILLAESFGLDILEPLDVGERITCKFVKTNKTAKPVIKSGTAMIVELTSFCVFFEQNADLAKISLPQTKTIQEPRKFIGENLSNHQKCIIAGSVAIILAEIHKLKMEMGVLRGTIFAIIFTK